MRKRKFFFFIVVLLVLSFVETASFFTTGILQPKGFFYKPSIADAFAYAEYLSKRDKLLGWPFPELFGRGEDFDLKGSRIVPSFPDELEAQNCISLYGDSFTWSAEVDNEHAWGNILSSRVNCRVDNYGVGGYGSDQALIRFKQNISDDSSIVFINHLSENILRNVNQFRDLLSSEMGFGFKPVMGME